MAAALRAQGTDAEASDAAKLIITDANFGRAWVDTSATRELVLEHFAKSGPLQVVTGFISGTANGETTTLGRAGSDYTATLLGAMLQAEAVEIWTDVDGVMSADPRIVREAFSLESLSYDELMEALSLGRPGHAPGGGSASPRERRPDRDSQHSKPRLPRNYGEPRCHEQAGVPCSGHRRHQRRETLLRLEGTGLQGVPGTAQRLFGALARETISVILITQASSERSICFAVEPHDSLRAVEVVHGEFTLEKRGRTRRRPRGRGSLLHSRRRR